MKEIFSKKLGKQVPLEVYISEDGLSVVTATSLKQVFEGIKEERGIKEDIKWEAKFNDHGEFYYAGATYRLMDKTGYDSVFVGESSPETLLSDISRKYPGQMAVNRAMAEGILMYLQLDVPGRAFADIQVPDRKLTNSDVASVPQMNDDMAIPAEPSRMTAPAETADEKGAQKSGNTGVTADNTAAAMEPVHADNSQNAAGQTVDTANDDSIIKFGPYNGKTVRQLFDSAKTDIKAQRTINIAIKGIGLPTEYDRQVFAYIALKAKGAQ